MRNRIEKSLAEIILHAPALGYITGAWREIIETRDISTMATNGISLMYNPDFVATLSDSELTAVLLHEIFHCVYLHPTEITVVEQNSKVKELYDIAMEIVVNATVKEFKKWELPGKPFSILKDESHSLEKIYHYDSLGHNHTAKEIYEEIVKKFPPQKLATVTTAILGSSGSGKDSLRGDVLPLPDKNAQQEAVERSIATIEKLRKQVGTLPQGLQRLLKKLQQSRVPWQRILQNFIATVVKGYEDMSWQKPNWRKSQDFILPGKIDREIDPIVVAVDTSGSISQKELTSFASEIAKLSSICSEITVVTTDAQVHEVVKIKDAKDVLTRLKFKGGGGTNFSLCLKKLRNVQLWCSLQMVMLLILKELLTTQCYGYLQKIIKSHLLEGWSI